MSAHATFDRAVFRTIRRERALSQEELARIAGVAKRTIANLESGKVAPRPSTLRLLADALGVDPTQLMKSPSTDTSDRQSAAGTGSAPRTTDATPTNLRRRLTSFIGRHAELRDLRALVQDVPLVTLSGVGGTGKTRLAIEFARLSIHDYPGGVWLVELASVKETADLAAVVAGAIRVAERPGVSLRNSLVQSLAGSPTLLLMDNCEHVLQPCRELVFELLSECEQLTVLATSREPLGVSGEHVFKVPALDVPEHGEESPTALADCDSVLMFLDRAKAYRPNLEFDDTTAALVASLCRQLQGSPLAIEIGAGALQSLSLGELADRVQEVIPRESRSLLGITPHHASALSLIGWSYELLEDQARSVLTRLSVFPATFDADAVRNVLGGEAGPTEPPPSDPLVDICRDLAVKSLLEMEEGPAGESRFLMLELVRQFAGRKLDDETRKKDEAAFVSHFALRAADEEREFKGTEQAEAFQRVEEDFSNYRLAVELAASEPGLLPHGLALLGSLGRYWVVRGLWTEGRSLCSLLLAAAADDRSRERARVETCAGVLASYLADYPAARTHYRRVVEIVDRNAEPATVAATLMNLSVVEMQQGNIEESASSIGESVEIFRQLEDRPHLGIALTNLGAAYERLDRLSEAKEALTEALEVRRELGDRKGIAVALNNLGAVLIRLEEFDRAEPLLLECSAVARELKDLPQEANIWEQRGHLARARGTWDAAGQAYLEAARLFRAVDDDQGTADALDGLALALAGQGSFPGEIVTKVTALREANGLPRNPILEKSIQGLQTAQGIPTGPATGGNRHGSRLVSWADLVAEVSENFGNTN